LRRIGFEPMILIITLKKV